MRTRLLLYGRVFALASIAVLTLSSCLNLIEYIGKEPNGNTRMTIVFTISKSVIAIAEQSGESADSIFASMTSAFDQLKKEAPPGVSVRSRKIDDSQQFGYQMNISYPSTAVKNATSGGASTSLIPIRKGSNIIIDFGTSTRTAESQNSSEDSMTQLMLSSDKFQLLINKNYASEVKSAVFTDKTNTVDMTRIDLGQLYLIEMPFIYLIQSKGDAKIVIGT